MSALQKCQLPHMTQVRGDYRNRTTNAAGDPTEDPETEKGHY